MYICLHTYVYVFNCIRRGTGHKGICGNTTKKGLHLHGNFDELTPYRIGDRTRDEGKSGYLKDTSIISVRSSAIHSGVLSSAGTRKHMRAHESNKHR